MPQDDDRALRLGKRREEPLDVEAGLPCRGDVRRDEARRPLRVDGLGRRPAVPVAREIERDLEEPGREAPRDVEAARARVRL